MAKKVFLKLCFLVISTIIIGHGFSIIYSFIENNLINNSNFEISTIHGNLIVNDPLAVELIKSPAMQRLKNIHQYGTMDYVLKHKINYNRFDHSLGVYYLLCKHGAPRTEQIAGLLHDVSHTVFSHACDFLFMGNQTTGAYQDTVHDKFLETCGIKQILENYGMSVNDVMPKNKNFRALEQDAPALCADRIEYNIYAAHMDDLLSKEDIQKIYRDLHFDGCDWYFDNQESARNFALIPLHQTMYMWTGPNGVLVNQWTSQALKRAMEVGLIEKDDILYRLTDDEMWQKLCDCRDSEVNSLVNKIIYCDLHFSLTEDTNCECKNLKAKFRGVDPFVKTSNGLVNLTKLDANFKKEYDLVKSIMKNGWCVVLHETPKFKSRKVSEDPRLKCSQVQLLQDKNSVYCVS